MTGSSAGPVPAARTLGGQGAGAAGSAEGATTADGAATAHAAAQSYRSSCASVPESGDEEDAGASVALAAAPRPVSGAAAEGGPAAKRAKEARVKAHEKHEEENSSSSRGPSPGGARGAGPVSGAAPRTDEGVDESDEDEDDEGEEGEEAEPPLPQALSQRWRSLRWSVLAAVRASQPRPAGEGQGEGSTRELV